MVTLDAKIPRDQVRQLASQVDTLQPEVEHLKGRFDGEKMDIDALEWLLAGYVHSTEVDQQLCNKPRLVPVYRDAIMAIVADKLEKRYAERDA